jgi:hypothetical protein
MLVEDKSRNVLFFFQVLISHVLHLISICDLFTDMWMSVPHGGDYEEYSFLVFNAV